VPERPKMRTECDYPGGLFPLPSAQDPIGFPGEFHTGGGNVLYDGDPFNGGNYIADAPDQNAAYSATVSSSATPEPGLFPVIGLVLAVIGAIRFWPKARKARAAPVAIVAIISGTILAGADRAQEEPKADTRQRARARIDQRAHYYRGIHRLRAILPRLVRFAQTCADLGISGGRIKNP
jgi:hypothetical protein